MSSLEVVGAARRVMAARAHQHAHLVLGALHRLGVAVGAGVDVTESL